MSVMISLWPLCLFLLYEIVRKGDGFVSVVNVERTWFVLCLLSSFTKHHLCATRSEKISWVHEQNILFYTSISEASGWYYTVHGKSKVLKSLEKVQHKLTTAGCKLVSLSLSFSEIIYLSKQFFFLIL